MLWGFYSYAGKKDGGQATAQFKYTYESKSYFNGLTFALYSVMFSFSLLIPIFVAMSAGAQIAGEANRGTLRMICIRPGFASVDLSIQVCGSSASHLFVDGLFHRAEPAGRTRVCRLGQP